MNPQGGMKNSRHVILRAVTLKAKVYSFKPEASVDYEPTGRNKQVQTHHLKSHNTHDGGSAASLL